MHKINITPSDTLLQLDIYLTIGKTFYLDFSKSQPHVASNFLLNIDYISELHRENVAQRKLKVSNIEEIEEIGI